MNNDIAKSLTELATLRISHGAVQHARNAVEQAMTTGDLLLEAKEQVQQGQWSQWLQEHCEVSDRTARLYMQLAEKRATIEASEDAANLTPNSAVRLSAPPTDDEFLEETAAKINVKLVEAKIHVAIVKKALAEVRATFDNEVKFKAWLQEEFPGPTDPSEKELAEQLSEMFLMIAGIIPMDDN
jgi:hypothetical protein